jgi:hypothetical protein
MGKSCEGQLKSSPPGDERSTSDQSFWMHTPDMHAALLASAKAIPTSSIPSMSRRGDIVDICVLWKDEKGEKHQSALWEWCSTVKKACLRLGLRRQRLLDRRQTSKALSSQQRLIYVSIPAAMLDLPVKAARPTQPVVPPSENIRRKRRSPRR